MLTNRSTPKCCPAPTAAAGQFLQARLNAWRGPEPYLRSFCCWGLTQYHTDATYLAGQNGQHGLRGMGSGTACSRQRWGEGRVRGPEGSSSESRVNAQQDTVDASYHRGAALTTEAR